MISIIFLMIRPPPRSTLFPYTTLFKCTVSCAAPIGHVADRRDNVGVGGAAADIATHAFGDFRVCQSWLRGDIGGGVARPTGFVFAKHRHGRTNLPWSAIPALHPVMAHEGGLHRMEIVAVRQAFDRDNLIAPMHRRESQAAIYPLPVDDHRAGTALPLIAALLRAR